MEFLFFRQTRGELFFSLLLIRSLFITKDEYNLPPPLSPSLTLHCTGTALHTHAVTKVLKERWNEKNSTALLVSSKQVFGAKTSECLFLARDDDDDGEKARERAHIQKKSGVRRDEQKNKNPFTLKV